MTLLCLRFRIYVNGFTMSPFDPAITKSLDSALRDRLISAAIDHPIWAAPFSGPLGAFPMEILQGRVHDVKWGRVFQYLVPTDFHVAEVDDGILEVLALWGSSEALAELQGLAREVAINRSADFVLPAGHGLTVMDRPETAWVRWLFDQAPAEQKRYRFIWHRTQPIIVAVSELGDHQQFDPFRDRGPQRAWRNGLRELPCLVRTIPNVSRASVNLLSNVRPAASAVEDSEDQENDTLVVDESKFTVRWKKNASVFLGNTKEFRLLQSLWQSEGQYIEVNDLASRLGGDEFAKIAPVKSRLVGKLRNNGLSELAGFIRTQTGHYGLFLPSAIEM